MKSTNQADRTLRHSYPFAPRTFFTTLFLLTLGFFASTSIHSQQVIGAFHTMDGGFEGQNNISVVPNYGTGLSYSTWNLQNSTTASATVSSSLSRSGNKSVTLSNGSTVTTFSSPTTPSTGMITNSTAYTVQFFYRTSGSTAITNVQRAISVDGTAFPGTFGALTLPGTNGAWNLIRVSTTSGNSSFGLYYGVVMFRLNGSTSGTFNIDDFVTYAGAADLTAPAAPGAVTISNATTSALTVAWNASASVDGGGYVVVRYAVSPYADNDPNQNGIYAINNIISNGTDNLNGTVRYIGTGTSFTDNSLVPGTTYYYKVYTVDKAFNYSSESSSSGKTCASAPTTASKIPSVGSVCQGTTLTLGGPATGGGDDDCIIEYRYSDNSGATWSPASTEIPVFQAGFYNGTQTNNVIQARRNNCGSACTGPTAWATVANWFSGPIPAANNLTNSNVSNGQLVPAFRFSGNANTYSWTNSDPSIGLPASGTGNIPAFTAINNGTNPITATITVTPSTFVGQAYIPNNNGNVLFFARGPGGSGVFNTGGSPQGVSANASGTRVYISSPFTGSLMVFNSISNTVVTTIFGLTGAYPVAVSPDESKVYVAGNGNLYIINAQTNTLTNTISIGGPLTGIVFSPDGLRAYINTVGTNTVTVFNTVTNTIITSITGFGHPISSLGITPDGSKVYVSTNGPAVYAVNTSSNTIQTVIPTAGTGGVGVAAHPDGSKIYVAHSGNNTVSVISTATNSVINTYGAGMVGLNPLGISIDPANGSLLYVANNGSSSISIINTVTNTLFSVVGSSGTPLALGNFLTGAAYDCIGTPQTFTITVNPPCTAATWTGAVSSDWHNPANWSCNEVPTAVTDVTIPNFSPSIQINSPATCKNINAGTGSFIVISSAWSITGTTSTNGTIYLNNGANITGSDFVYGAQGTLVLNGTGTPIQVNADNPAWPASNGPQNVTAQGTGGITMNTARTVPMLFGVGGPVNNANNLSLHLVRIYSGSFSGSPTYSSLGSLIYQSGGTFGRTDEWLPGASSGPGCPNNVSIESNTTLNLANGTSHLPFYITNNLSIQNGSTLQMDGPTPMTASLTAGGNVSFGGSFGFSSLPGGDFIVKGALDFGSATANTNGRNIILSGTNSQSISSNIARTIDNLVIDKPGGIAANTGQLAIGTLSLLNGLMSTSVPVTVNGLIGGSSTSYVYFSNTNGLMIRPSAAAPVVTLFPIGTLSTYDPVTVSPTNAASFTVKAKSAGSNFQMIAPVADFNLIAPRQWDIAASGTPGPTTVAISYGGSAFTAPSPVIGHYNGTSWQEIPASFNSNTWTASISNFSPFGVGTAGGFVQGPPTISSFSPTSGYTGTNIVILGNNFLGATAVTIGGVPASSFTVYSNGNINAIVANGATGPVSVTTPAGTANSADNFTYNGYITVSDGNWNNGGIWLGGNVPPAGASVTIDHTVTMNVNPTISSGNKITVNGRLNCGTNTISGSGLFVLSPNATLSTGNASGISGTISASKSLSTSANYIFSGGNNQNTDGMPSTVKSLTIANSGGFGSNKVNLWQSPLTITGTTNALNLQSGLLTIQGSGINMAANSEVVSIGGNFDPQYPGYIYCGSGGTVTMIGNIGFGEIDLFNNTNLVFNGSSTIRNRLDLQANAGTVTGTPTYLLGSQLRYSNGTTYTRGDEWTSNTAGPGYPYGVYVGTQLSIYNGDPLDAIGFVDFLTIAGTLDLTGMSVPFTGGGFSYAGTPVRSIILSNLPGGDLHFSGMWSLNLTNFTRNGRKVVLFGSSQSMGGNATAMTFDNIEFNNAVGTTVNSNLFINNELKLTSGKISTTTNKVIMNSGAVLTGGSSSAYIDGYLQRTAVDGNNFYPIGTNSFYAPVNISMTGVNGTLELTGNVLNGLNTPGANLDPAAHADASWVITRSGAGTFSNYDIGIDFTQTPNTGIPSNYILMKYDAAWTNPSSSVSGTTITGTGLNSFSEFQVGELDCEAPAIVSDPTGGVICNGSSIILSVSATGSDLNYQWKKNGTINVGSNQNSFTATEAGSYTVEISNDCGNISSAAAVVTINSYTITATAGPNGSISPAGVTTVECGLSQTYNISADPGYIIQDVKVDNISIGAVNTHSFNNITTNHTIDVTFIAVTLANPALVSIDMTDLLNNTANPNLVPYQAARRLHIPILNLAVNTSEIIPAGTTKVRIDLGSQLELNTGYDITSSPWNNYFNWSSTIEAGHVVVYGDQYADIPGDFFGITTIDVKGNGVIGGSSTITTDFLVTNHNNTLVALSDIDPNNNQTTLNYTELNEFVLALNNKVDILCNGYNTGSLTVQASGGSAPYQYQLNAGPFVPGGILPFTFNGLTAGTYTVTSIDAIGQTSSINVTITEPSAITFATASISHVTCFGYSNGSIISSASGGTGAISYTISPNIGTQSPAGTFSGLTTGTYTITATDANNCTASIIIEVEQPALLELGTPTVSHVSCYGGSNGSIIIVATGGTGTVNYSISPATGSQPNPGVFAGLIAGTYTITATDANGCTATTIVTVTEPADIVFDAPLVSHLNCFGDNNGSISVLATGGTGLISYSISPNTGSQNSPGVFTGLVAGTYVITATDINNCTETISMNVDQPQQLLFGTPLITHVYCNAGNTGAVTVSATGGTGTIIYTISPNIGTQSLPGQFTGLITDTYTITATDANNCTATQLITISEPPVLTATASGTNIDCYNNGNGTATVTVGGGTAVYNYNWVATAGGLVPAGQENGQSLTGLIPGVYTVTVTDANGCTATSSYTVTQPDPITALQGPFVVVSHVTCNGAANGSIDLNLTVQGGTPGYTYSYSWTRVGGGYTNNTEDIGGLSPGTYNVVITVTDLNNCTAIFSIGATITEPAVLSASVTSITHVNCAGNASGSVTITATGGTTPYEFSINGGTTWWPTANTFYTFNGLVAGPYTVMVKDANGCLKSVSFNINQPNNPDLSLGSVFDNNIFLNNADEAIVIYNIAELAGKAATPATLRIFKPAGYDIIFNGSQTSATIMSTNYLVDNTNWTLTNTGPNNLYFDFSRTGAGNTINCNELVRIAFKLKRNTPNISAFNLNAQVRIAGGELILSNNTNSIIMIGE